MLQVAQVSAQWVLSQDSGGWPTPVDSPVAAPVASALAYLSTCCQRSLDRCERLLHPSADQNQTTHLCLNLCVWGSRGGEEGRKL